MYQHAAATAAAAAVVPHLVQLADYIEPHIWVRVTQQVEEHRHQVLNGWLLAQLRRQLHHHACKRCADELAAIIGQLLDAWHHLMAAAPGPATLIVISKQTN
jgi:hypothetical protein